MKATIILPSPIQKLLTAQAAFDTTAFAAVFAADAVVNDENQTYNGREEVQKWNTETNANYQTCFKPLDHVKLGAEDIVTIQMSGTFPGSPLAAKFHFVIKDDSIASLHII